MFSSVPVFSTSNLQDCLNPLKPFVMSESVQIQMFGMDQVQQAAANRGLTFPFFPSSFEKKVDIVRTFFTSTVFGGVFFLLYFFSRISYTSLISEMRNLVHELQDKRRSLNNR